MASPAAPDVAEDLMAQVLQNELLAVPGIAGAEVDADDGVAGVKVQLAEGADAEAVGAAVRRILGEHGMRPAPSDDEQIGGPPPPPGAPGSVVTFPLVGAHAVDKTEVSGVSRLESVAVEETPNGVSVIVRSGAGGRATRSLDASGTGMDEAVAGAVAELTGHSATTLLGVAEAELSGHTVITVVVGLGDQFRSGSAIQTGGRAYAVARATWSALD
jgi:hypothetical protein